MKLSRLLAQRDALLRQAHLANLAFAYDRLEDFAQRIQRARLSGAVTLQSASPDEARYAPTLTVCEGNQSLIEEHFTETDIMALADVLSFMTCNDDLDLTFQLEDVSGRFLTTIRQELVRACVTIDHTARDKFFPASGNNFRGCVHDDETL